MTNIDTIVTDRIKRYKCVELVDVPLLGFKQSIRLEKRDITNEM